jgi:hypothetical protein
MTSSGSVQKERKKYVTKFSHRKALVEKIFSKVFRPLVTFPCVPLSGHIGSNDSGLMSV